MIPTEYATIANLPYAHPFMTIRDNLFLVLDRINAAKSAARRPLESVQLLAVSKTQPASAVKAAMDAGQQHFGENYLQDALSKIPHFPEATWHFIGAIQSNKTRDIAKHFDYVHSVSNLKVIQRLNAQRDEMLGLLNIFLQINVAGEVGKSGADRAEIEDLAAAALESPRLKLLGLMAIPPAGLTPEELGAYYKQLTELRSDLTQSFGHAFPECSFGMSQDLEVAIAAGSTWVRVGKAIFGPRTGAKKGHLAQI